MPRGYNLYAPCLTTTLASFSGAPPSHQDSVAWGRAPWLSHTKSWGRPAERGKEGPSSRAVRGGTGGTIEKLLFLAIYF